MECPRQQFDIYTSSVEPAQIKMADEKIMKMIPSLIQINVKSGPEYAGRLMHKPDRHFN